ncbi:MAG: Re/Si-specific NAD(P)(+) transhydrogenase subunit alpha [Rhodothalassiaceae bacterium]
MRIAVLKEQADGERRVAATPETVKKLTAAGHQLVVQEGAGTPAAYPDAAYQEAGAELAKSVALSECDAILAVQAPDPAQLEGAKQGSLLIAMLNPFNNGEKLAGYAQHGLIAFAMEFMPRITRAQAMDVLSSQSNLAGYKAVLDATEQFARAMPMMMTAAGTVAPARVFVMGAGVAGLQAIATARRLGAVVSATDVRLAAKEQVESLGAKFVMVEDEEAKQAETEGGYAKEMSNEYKNKQAELVAGHIAKQDIVITTALIPGRPAPKLIDKAMVESMKPGSVIVDLAVEQGGNCALSKPGKVVDHKGVKIVGHRNMPSRLATDASALYAKNLLNFLGLIADKDTGAVKIDWDDEIIKGVLVVKDGAVVHEKLKQAA